MEFTTQELQLHTERASCLIKKKKGNNNKNILKMKGDVGMSKPKKHKNKIEMVPYQQN